MNELEGQRHMNVFVEMCITFVLERSESARKHTAVLLHDCIKAGKIKKEAYLNG